MVKNQTEKAKKIQANQPFASLKQSVPGNAGGLWTLLLMEDRNFRTSAHLHFRCFHVIAVDN